MFFYRSRDTRRNGYSQCRSRCSRTCGNVSHVRANTFHPAAVIGVFALALNIVRHALSECAPRKSYITINYNNYRRTAVAHAADQSTCALVTSLSCCINKIGHARIVSYHLRKPLDTPPRMPPRSAINVEIRRGITHGINSALRRT